jgi:hypothetical protein
VPPLRCHLPTTAKTNYNIDKLFEMVAEKVKPGRGAARMGGYGIGRQADDAGGKPSWC